MEVLAPSHKHQQQDVLACHGDHQYPSGRDHLVFTAGKGVEAPSVQKSKSSCLITFYARRLVSVPKWV